MYIFRQCRKISGKLVPNPNFLVDLLTELENVRPDSIGIQTSVRNWHWPLHNRMAGILAWGRNFTADCIISQRAERIIFSCITKRRLSKGSHPFCAINYYSSLVWPCATLDRSKGQLTIIGYTIGLAERAQRARSTRDELSK